MGSMRTWSLAAVAGIFVVVVAHQRSSAENGQPNAAPPAVTTVPTSAAPASARVTGLPDFTQLVAESGAAVVNISVTEKAQKPGEGARGRTRCPSSSTTTCRIRNGRRPATASDPGSS